MIEALRWDLAWGSFIEDLEDMAERGIPVAALETRPELPERLEWVRQAFSELSSDRQHGLGGAGPIMFSSIDRYATRHGIDGEAFDNLTFFIREMDDVFLEHVRKKKDT